MQRGTLRRISGFTLIELLIVVAIIAILAAIAVPNFLEAQTRAKIARSKADMRTIATALEAYSVDFNRYILGIDESPTLTPPNWGLGAGTTTVEGMNIQNRRWSSLTTPVAYLTSIPIDPLRKKSQADVFFGSYIYFQFRSFLWNFEPKLTGANLTLTRQGKANGFTWHMFSWGPWGQSTARPFFTYGGNFAVAADLATAANALYDPTNGTMSVGLLIRSNKGIMEKPGV